VSQAQGLGSAYTFLNGRAFGTSKQSNDVWNTLRVYAHTRFVKDKARRERSPFLPAQRRLFTIARKIFALFVHRALCLFNFLLRAHKHSKASWRRKQTRKGTDDCECFCFKLWRATAPEEMLNYIASSFTFSLFNVALIFCTRFFVFLKKFHGAYDIATS